MRVSTNAFYKTLGFQSYDCIDLDDAYCALPFNLNVNFANIYNFTDQFDLVTNFGVTEHVINQGTCFENIHNLCKKDGIMLHALPMYNYINHGFYNYSPKFFEKLIAYDEYDFISAYLRESGVSNDGSYYVKLHTFKRLDDMESLCDYIKDSKSEAINFPQRMGVCGFDLIVALRKTSNKPFAYPLDIPLCIVKDKKILSRALGVDFEKIKNIAIFGSGIAGKMVREFAKNHKINILCFIDDFSNGIIDEIPIVPFEEFREKYQNKCDFVCKGPHQGGDIENREGLLVKVLHLR